MIKEQKMKVIIKIWKMSSYKLQKNMTLGVKRIRKLPKLKPLTIVQKTAP